MAARVAEQGARVGYVVLDLETGSQCTGGESEVFRSASLEKLPVMVEAYEQAARGEFSFDQTRRSGRVTPSTAHPVPASLHLARSRPARRPADDHALGQYEALALLERLGPERVGDVATRLGLRDTAIPGAFDTSARDIARVYELLDAGRLVSPDASAEMLALLRQQEVVDLIPAALPAGVEVAHKTGIVDHVLHDAGIGRRRRRLRGRVAHRVVDRPPAARSVIHALLERAWAAFEAPRALTPAVRMVFDPPPVPLADDADGGGATLNLIPPPTAAATRRWPLPSR